MKIRKLFLAAGILIVPVLLYPCTSATAEEMWLVWSDYNQDGNPVLISQLRQGGWRTEDFPPGQAFDANFAPSPGIDKTGSLWMVWAASMENTVPSVYWSRNSGSGWSAPRRADGESARWECTPAIAFDRAGKPVVTWVAVAGGSTEIFCSGWAGDGFGPAFMVSAADDSPDGRPSLAIGDNGNINIFWEGWQDGHSQIFLRRYESGTWSPEKTADPRPGTDQILPTAVRLRDGRVGVTWWEDGNEVTFEEGKSALRNSNRSLADRFSGLDFPEADGSAWLLVAGTEGEPAAYRYRTLLPPPERTTSRLAGKTLATHYYIGYGDDITYPRSIGPDNGNWYGTYLTTMLPDLFPGQTFVLYNNAYPLSVTSDLLNGPGSPPYLCPGINAVIDSHPLATKILIMGGTRDIGWGVALPDTTYNLGQMIDRARAKGVEPILATIIPRLDKTNNYNLSTDLSTNYISPLAVTKHCTLANPWQVFMNYGDIDYISNTLYGYPYYWDGINPNGAEGNQEIADAWYAAFAAATPTPAPLILDSGDYNGDSTSDIAIFRKSSGLWAVKGVTRVYFGTGSDTPASGDFDGDGTTDLALFRPASGLWAIRGITRAYFGGSSDIPAPGDYDGNGTCDAGIFRGSSGLWVVRGVTRVYFGSSSDLPVPVYGGLGESAKHLGIFRPASGLWAIRGVTRTYFGGSSDQPVPANYSDTPDSLDIGIFRASSGLWAVKGVTRVYFGSSQDRPVVGNYTGFIPADAGIFRPSSGLWAVKGLTRVYFGSSDDIPVTALSINPSSAAIP